MSIIGSVEKVTGLNQNLTVRFEYELLISGENPLSEKDALLEITKHKVYTGDVDLLSDVPRIAKSVLELYGADNTFPSRGPECDRLKDIVSGQICGFYLPLGERGYYELKDMYGINSVVSGVFQQLELDLPQFDSSL